MYNWTVIRFHKFNLVCTWLRHSIICTEWKYINYFKTTWDQGISAD